MKTSRFSEQQIAFVLRQAEEENGELKRIVADLALGKEMLQDVIKRKL
jgi:putative transposase